MKKYSRVYVEITNVCNRSCSFCPGTKRASRTMKVEEFRIICEKLRGVTDYLYLHVMGEPLIHPNLAEFISIDEAQTDILEFCDKLRKLQLLDE